MSAYLASHLILLFSIIPSVFNRNESCCDWEVYDSAGSSLGCVQPDINTEYACKMTCMANAECFSFGWNGRGVKDNCALFYQPTRMEPLWEGVRHWVINRMGFCEVPCIYAFSAYCGKYVLDGTVRKSVAETKDCKLACMNAVGCTGFDWWPQNDTDRRCFLNFKPSALHIGSSSLHYEYMRTLCHIPTEAFVVSQWVYVSGITLVSFILSIVCYVMIYYGNIQQAKESSLASSVPPTVPKPKAAPAEESRKVPNTTDLTKKPSIKPSRSKSIKKDSRKEPSTANLMRKPSVKRSRSRTNLEKESRTVPSTEDLTRKPSVNRSRSRTNLEKESRTVPSTASLTRKPSVRRSQSQHRQRSRSKMNVTDEH